jgi:hypothetical protein
MIGAGAFLVSPAVVMLLFAVAAALMRAGMSFRHRFLELFPGLIGDILCLLGKIRVYPFNCSAEELAISLALVSGRSLPPPLFARGA